MHRGGAVWMTLGVIVLQVLSWSTSALGNTVTGCGGVVKLSPAMQEAVGKKDFSRVKMTLLTPEGFAKDSTECAPNGYYFLPVYTTGSFVLRVDGPEGWIFEPATVAVRIDEATQICRPEHGAMEAGEDINFFLQGFQVSGTVESAVGCNKPMETGAMDLSGITVQLQRAGASSSFMSKTDKTGRYSFNGVQPGDYSLMASHPTWTLTKSTASVTVKGDSAEVGQVLLVSGYDVSGSVRSTGNEAVLGVDLLLYSDAKDVAVSCPPTSLQIPASIQGGKKPLCVSQSDSDGVFRFANIPCGTYTVIPFYSGTSTTYDVVPASMTFEVQQGSVHLPQDFQVMGFSISGKVLDLEGKGIADVTVQVNGKDKTTTNSNGLYKLDQLSSGKYDLSASKEHYQFNANTAFRVTPSLSMLPDITLKSVDVCGRVLIQEPVAKTKNRVVTATNTADHKTQTSAVDQTGTFCFQLAPGSYSIEPTINSQEKHAGLILFPEKQSVQVSQRPVLDVSFSQIRATVSGKVQCKETPCDPSISVSLSQVEDPTKRMTTGLGVGVVGTESVPGDHFTFRDVLPGKYQISVEKDNWCWKEESMQLNVDGKDISNIQFTHTGYSATVSLSNDFQVKFKNEKTGKEDLHSLNTGINHVCLPEPGKYQITPVSPCYGFQHSVYQYDTSNPSIPEIVVINYSIKGNLAVQSDQKTAPVDITVRLVQEDGKEVTVVPSVIESDKAKGVHTYQWASWANAGEKLRIEPSSPSLLFYPQRRSVSIQVENGCVPEVDTFEGRPGLFIQGSISPPLAGANVSVLAVDQAPRSVITGKDGKYSLGPLYDDVEYTVVAEKDGYRFIKTSNSGFKAEKLASIIVNVKGKIPGVLLSLSGESYRSNNMTDSEGKFAFMNLAPGDYFLRPLLKEYAFDPSSRPVSIQEGQDVVVEISATRVAYSCYGKVSSLNGQSESAVSIEAVPLNSKDAIFEEAKTDSNGNYRLRGLLPSTSYSIHVISSKEEDPIERVSPHTITVQVNAEDINDVDFIIFRNGDKYQLTGTVDAESSFLSNLEVCLFQDDSLLSRVPLGPSNFFSFQSLPSGEYSVRLETTLSPRDYLLDSTEEIINLGPGATHISLTFKASAHNQDLAIISTTPIFTVFLVALTAAVLFYREVIASTLQPFIHGTKTVETRSVNDDWLPNIPQTNRKGSRR